MLCVRMVEQQLSLQLSVAVIGTAPEEICNSVLVVIDLAQL